MVKQILEKTGFGEFDYNLLLFCLSEYKNPRNKISQLIKNKEIIRVKKGLYVFGPQANRMYSLEILANLIYGPSYISCEYALSFYGLIPEKVNLITSITNKRNKYFKTLVGDFSYQYLARDKYNCGITQQKIDSSRNIIIATKEKALVDLICRIKDVQNNFEMKEYLLQNLRMDEESLSKFSITQIKDINRKFRLKIIDVLIEYLQSLKK